MRMPPCLSLTLLLLLLLPLLLLASCVTPPPPPPPLTAYPYTALERACLERPFDASAWDALAEALRAGGEPERAAAMARQASTLRAHDLRRDLATVASARMPQAAAAADGLRIELRRLGSAMVELHYVAAGPASVAAGPSRAQAVRLEISNGNGVTGMAARLGRELDGEQWRTVRLSNIRPYTQRRSRIEYGPQQRQAAQALARRLQVERTVVREENRVADLRVVLGHDMRK